MSGFQLVYDYPIEQASLAKRSTTDPQVAERFELFFNGLELANGFSELTDAREQRQRFVQNNAERAKAGLNQVEIDEALLAALQSGLPDCAGVAVGLDRLLMVLLGLHHLDDVLLFR